MNLKRVISICSSAFYEESVMAACAFDRGVSRKLLLPLLHSIQGELTAVDCRIRTDRTYQTKQNFEWRVMPPAVKVAIMVYTLIASP
jgi:hypothetical protein